MKGWRRGFSLLELLVVLACAALLVAVAVPAVSSVAGGSQLNRAGQLLADQIAFARQAAVGRSREVQVRLYESDAAWRGLQVWRVEQSPTGAMLVAAHRFRMLPEAVSLDPDRSPLLGADPAVAGEQAISGRGNLRYRGFRFRANGAMNAGIGVTNNFLTLRAARGGDPNMYTVQVNPLTGRISVYRP